jgi:hypothetical protein
MASMDHEALVTLFRNRPRLAAELLHDALGLGLPAFTEARIESAELGELAPTAYQADLVVLLLRGRAVLGIVVEVQLRRDRRKRLTWPLYLATLRARLGCPTVLLVVTPDSRVGRWSARPIELGHPGFVLAPLVVGPEAVPVVTDPAEARRAPELAVLSALAHGRGPVGLEVAQAALNAAQAGGLEDDAVRLYADLVMQHLAAAARSALEALMLSGYEYRSPFAKRFIAEGREEGVALGKARAVLTVLRSRGVEVGLRARTRIERTTDAKLLDRWLRRAVKVATTTELFRERAPRSKARR